MSFDTMMASATVSTITIAVAADRPPMNATSVISWDCAESGSATTNMSLSTRPAEKVNSPAIAIGKTNRLMSTRYSGNSHEARRISDSLWFSTTVTWNCRGNSTIAKSDGSVIAQNEASCGARVSTAAVLGRSSAWANRANGPPNITKVTKIPTARKVANLTTDSVAIASIKPS